MAWLTDSRRGAIQRLSGRLGPALIKETDMHKTIIAGLAGLAAAQVLANSFGLKPGLWETRIVKMVVDGQDKTSMMSDAASKMQAAMANMPPEQRERMEAMMKERGGPSMGGDGTTRICVSPELASQEKPFTGKDEHCQPVSMTHAGNRTSYTVIAASTAIPPRARVKRPRRAT